MGRILGLDPGERRVGVALSDPSGTIASPHGVIVVTRQGLADEIRDICVDRGVTRIVVGLPVTLAGGEGRSADAARRLAQLAAEATGLPVELYDERFTSAAAEAALLEGNVRRRRRRQVRDQVAAAVMLQGYLDSTRASGDPDDRVDGGSAS